MIRIGSDHRGRLRGQAGFGLIQVLVAIGLLGVVTVSSMQLLKTMMVSAKSVDQKAEFLAVTNNVSMALTDDALCAGAFRSDPATKLEYRPDLANVDAPYETEVPAVYLGDSLILQGADEKFQRQDLSFKVKSLKLKRIPGKPIGSQMWKDPAGNLVSSHTHAAMLELVAERSGEWKGDELRREWAVNLVVNQASRRVESCKQESKVTMVRAMAKRSGITIKGRSCTDYTSPNSDLVEGRPSCADQNSNGFCDSDSDYTVKPHPQTGKSLWKKSFPARTAAAGPKQLSGNEGRCIVTVHNNTSGEPLDDIFVIRNGGSYDGLGCRTDKGWFLLSCMMNNYGEGDTDVIIESDANSEYCHTNDWTQPHEDGPFGLQYVTISVVCAKLQ